MGRRDRPAPRPAQARGCVLGFAVGAALAGCGSNPGNSPDAGQGPVPPAVWQPKPGDAPNWDIQLAAPFDVSAPRTMYDLDLWSLVPSPTTLDYGDGKPVTVPRGALAGTIAQLHARTPPAIVICYVETGMLDLQRPDAVKFLGYDPDPTQIPDNKDVMNTAVKGAPASGSVIGWSLGDVKLRFLDARQASRAQWAPILFKRFDLALQIGCDGVDPAHNDSAAYATGFNITSDDALTWYAEVAQEGHARKLSTGMRNSVTLLESIDPGANQFDWLILERCGELEAGGTQGCDTARPFLNAQKDVFAIDYNVAQDGTAQTATTVCAPQLKETIVDGLYKDAPPTGKTMIRQQCGTLPP
ncbi:MAG TPA: endo alpha-1,4 polygalactosaminidase [Kofleriaceae bacterium]